MILVSAWVELDFGRRHGNRDAYFWPDDHQLFRAWRELDRVFLVIDKDDLARMRHDLEPAPRVFARWGKKSLS